VVNALIFLPFVNQFAALVTRITPDKPQVGAIAPKYIEFGLLRTPGIALAKARMEMLRMASRVQGMLVDVLPAILDGDIDTMADVEERDDEVDALHGLVLEYLGRISQQKLSEESSAELVDLLEAVNALEAIGDLVERNLVSLGYEKIEASIDVSLGTRALIEDYHKSVVEAFELALVAVTQKDQGAARTVSGMKREIRHLERDVTSHQTERLVADEPNRIATYRFETDVITNLKRVYYFSQRIARAAVPEHEQAGM
jgi:phosphate:Na+ symporter